MATNQLVPHAPPVTVPRPEQVRGVFLGLIGKDVEVAPARPVLPGQEPAAVAVYVTGEGAVGAVAACDLALAAYAGAAFGEVPLSEVEQCLAAGQLSADLADHVAEVANVLVSAFNQDVEAPPLQLQKMHPVGEELPADVAAMLRYVVRRLDVAVVIAGYGGGRLSAVAIA